MLASWESGSPALGCVWVLLAPSHGSKCHGRRQALGRTVCVYFLTLHTRLALQTQQSLAAAAISLPAVAWARTIALSKLPAHPHPHVQRSKEENRKPCLEKQAVLLPHPFPLWQELTTALPRYLIHFPTLGELN